MRPTTYFTIALLVMCASASAQLVEVNSFVVPTGTKQMEYSPSYNRLFLKDSGNSIRVLNATTGAEIEQYTSNYQFTDMDLVPGTENYLYAADFGGVRIGYGTVINPHHVHRYDLNTGTWDSQVAPKVAYQLEAVNDQQVLLHESDQWVAVTLNLYADPMVEQTRRGTNYRGNISFDPNYQRVLYGNSGSSSREIFSYDLIANAFVNAKTTGTYGSAQSGGGSTVVSTDGEHFYYGELQVDAHDVRTNLNTFPENIHAATYRYAFGVNGFYDPQTTALLGDLGFPVSAYAVSQDGMEIWALDGVTNTVHHFAEVPEPSSLLLLGLGCLALLGIRKKK